MNTDHANPNRTSITPGQRRSRISGTHNFPTEAAALKCVYLAIMSLDPTGRGQQRWSNRWKAALNAFEITFDGRLMGSYRPAADAAGWYALAAGG